MRRVPARPLRACFARSWCSVVVQENDQRTTPAQCNAKQTLSSHFTLHSSHFTLALHTCTSSQLISSGPSSSHSMSCAKHVAVLLCTTKLAQTTSQYYCVLQNMHKARPSTTLDHKACTKHFPVLLCTTKLAQTTSQYYFVLQYKACTKHVPVLLCTTKLAQTTSQYYFVL